MRTVGYASVTQAAITFAKLNAAGIYPTFVLWGVRSTRNQGYMRFNTRADLRRAAAIIDPDAYRSQYLDEAPIFPWAEIYIGAWALIYAGEDDES